MDIGSKSGYPSSALSNFSPHPFAFKYDGIEVECNSMEGLLQSFKFSNPEMQKHVCTLVGIKAKTKGRNKNWYTTQTLWWNGKPIKRDSAEYQKLLDWAYACLATNKSFRNALLATGDAVLTHSIGKSSENETVLTRNEFCSRLTKLRSLFQNKL